MFDNVGGKIKGVAIVITSIGIIASFIMFFIQFRLAIERGDFGPIALSFVTLALGCLISWLSALAIYGLGQLIENSDIIVDKMRNNNHKENRVQTDDVDDNDKSFDEIVKECNLTIVQESRIIELKDWKDDGVISAEDCRDRILDIIKDQPLAIKMRIINKI